MASSWRDGEGDSASGQPPSATGLSPIVVGNSITETVPKQTWELFSGQQEDVRCLRFPFLSFRKSSALQTLRVVNVDVDVDGKEDRLLEDVMIIVPLSLGVERVSDFVLVLVLVLDDLRITGTIFWLVMVPIDVVLLLFASDELCAFVG
jgi:hypothetical protein